VPLAHPAAEDGAGDRLDVFGIGAAAPADHTQIEQIVQLRVQRRQFVDVTAIELGGGIELGVTEA
jgi:hypothetical protein